MFEVEDGSGSPTATSYVSVEYANTRINTYHNADYQDWTDKSTEQRQAALNIASQFFDTLLRWEGNILELEQALSFPRTEFEDSEGRKIEGVTDLIKNYVVAFALEQTKGNLSRDIVKLSREDFADTSDTYASPKVVADSKVVYNAMLDLTYRGYGRRRTTIVTAERA